MKVPRKVVVSGDKDAGRRLIGVADSQLRILENQMHFQGLKQYSRTVRYDDGTIIACWSCFSLQQVSIYVPQTGGEEEVSEEMECFANTGIALAKVLRVVDLEQIDTSEPGSPSFIIDQVAGIEVDPGDYPPGYFCTKTIRYDLQVCDSENYVLFENIASTDFTPHKPDDMVLVVMSRVEAIPQEVIDRNTDSPCGKPAFTSRVITHGDNVIAILPFSTPLPQYEYY